MEEEEEVKTTKKEAEEVKTTKEEVEEVKTTKEEEEDDDKPTKEEEEEEEVKTKKKEVTKSDESQKKATKETTTEATETEMKRKNLRKSPTFAENNEATLDKSESRLMSIVRDSIELRKSNDKDKESGSKNAVSKQPSKTNIRSSDSLNIIKSNLQKKKSKKLEKRDDLTERPNLSKEIINVQSKRDTEITIVDDQNDTDEIFIYEGKIPFTRQELELMATIMDDSDVTSSESVMSDKDEVDLLPFTNFLDELKHPDIEDVEDEEDIEEKKRSTIKEKKTKGIDEGAFVDPLTGQTISEEPKDESSEHESQVEEEAEEEEDSAFNLPDIEDTPPRKTDFELADETLQKIFFAEVLEEEEFIDHVAIHKEKEMKQLKRSLRWFLKKIIGKVVKTMEYVSPMTLLNESLDKKILIEVLISKWIKLQEEQRKSFLYHRHIVNYYRKKKNLRAITEEEGQSLINEIEKFKYANSELIYLIEKRKIWNEAITKKRRDLIEVETEIKSLLNASISEFERTVINTFCNGRTEKFQKDVNFMINRMARERDKLSETRFVYIVYLHNMISITNKLQKIETVGKDLTLNTFISLQTEINSFEKKIEERERDLLKERKRFNEELHVGSHTRELLQMKSKQLMKLMDVEKSFLIEKEYFRQRICKLKVQRETMRKEMSDLSFHNGLLGKTAILYDYDNTKENYRKIMKQVEFYRRKLRTSTDSLCLIETRISGL